MKINTEKLAMGLICLGFVAGGCTTAAQPLPSATPVQAEQTPANTSPEVENGAPADRLEPALAARLAEMGPQERLEVAIWLKAKGTSPADAPDKAADGSDQQVATLQQPLLDYLASRDIKPSEVSSSAPLIYVALSKAEILELANWPEVDRIYGPNQNTSE